MVTTTIIRPQLLPSAEARNAGPHAVADSAINSRASGVSR